MRNGVGVSDKIIKNKFDVSCFFAYVVYMKITEFLKQMKIESLAITKIKSELNKKSLTLVKTRGIL